MDEDLRILRRYIAFHEGETEEEALKNLKEALELYFEPPTPERAPEVRTVEVELGPAA
ncbi:hypothetical protein TthSNM11_10890 [Thermus thermophilus]|uniref:type II toxin-antitoxin system HicB family antitoxin n=1 Tax=Thermus thermophilus TaxID=274 RepID=UPI001FCDAC95|nr:hypothetical protein [Thermus thermophilus]BDG18886.1 hypothetical protein TthSNM11_10890 [Thermus thermophilus]